MVTAGRTTRLDRIRDACRGGTDWLLTRVNDKGSHFTSYILHQTLKWN